MEGRKQMGSSSSFTSELFDSKETKPSSSGIFDSMFSREPSTKVLSRESLRSALSPKSNDSATEAWNSEIQSPGDTSKKTGSETQSLGSKEYYVYQEQRVQPCHLSSSIYYGGQDIYSQPQTQNSQNSTVYSLNEAEDDSGISSRGNWWQGSLYY